MRWRRAPSALMAGALLALAACDGGGGGGDAGVDAGGDAGPGAMLTGVSISPETVSLEVGASQQLTVTGTFDDGTTSDISAQASFASSAEAIVTVAAGGRIAAVAVGTATVTATVDGFDPLTVSVTVVEPPPTDPTLPMAVDDFFQGRAGFSDAGPPLYTEDATCPTRAGGMAGVCHRFVWNGTGGAFTGAVWVNGTGFADATAVDVEPGATEVTFYAWGAAGGEVIELGAGITDNGGGGAADGAQARRTLTLTTTPTQYTVRLGPLVGYTSVAAGFVWAASASNNPSGATFYVDDIQWIRGETPTTPTLPMAVDVFFPGRAAFSSAGGAPLHTDDNLCPTRPEGAVGDCHHITYTGSAGEFSGAFWIDGSGFDSLSPVDVEDGATEVTFVAWGAAGGEVVDFGAGIMTSDGGEDRRRITLSTTPTRYTVPLARLQGYSQVYGAFIFGIGGNAAEFYIDDIQWVVGDALTPLALPMTVDTHYPNRSAFGDGGPPLHTETIGCPTRAGGMNGQCHTFTWSGTGGAFTGTFWTIGEGFTNLSSRIVAPGANAVRFYAWGAAGGEVIDFGAGGDFGDVGQDRRVITLSTTPTEYVIPLTNNASYSNVFAPFIWAANNGANPTGFTFYVDDIQWATVAAP